MVRILICSRREDLAVKLLDGIKGVVQQNRIGCELAYSTDTAHIVIQLKQDSRRYDVLILDARDDGCLSVAAALRRRNLTATLLFVVDEHPYDVRALLPFRLSGLITNPEDDGHLTAAVRAACSEQFRVRPYFMVKNKDVLMRVDFSDISFFESRQRIVVMHTAKQNIEFYAKLTDVLDKLPQERFLRCHQSYVVNMGKIRSLDKTARCFRMASGQSIEISKSLYADAAARFETFLGRSDPTFGK